MALFGDDKKQDERIAALEDHVRALTLLGILLNQQQDNAAAWRSEIRRRISEPEN
jgi:hypothetical protein